MKRYVFWILGCVVAAGLLAMAVKSILIVAALLQALQHPVLTGR